MGIRWSRAKRAQRSSVFASLACWALIPPSFSVVSAVAPKSTGKRRLDTHLSISSILQREFKAGTPRRFRVS